MKAFGRFSVEGGLHMLLRIRGVVTVAIVATALALAPLPASATPWGPIAQERDQASVITQVWEWISSLWSAASQPVQETSPTELETGWLLCSGPATDRGCAIDPNG
jgi:hypothetical protein